MNPQRTKTFALGFASGLFPLVAANLYSYDKFAQEECFDCLLGFGFPFGMYESGTIAHLDRIIWGGVVADVLVAVSMGIAIGWVISSLKQDRDSSTYPRDSN